MSNQATDCSIGFKKESSFGNGVTVDRFLEFTDETIDVDRNWYQGAGLRPGSRVDRSGRRALTSDGGVGDINLEVPTKGLGTFLELLFGVATSTLVSTALYQQLFTLAKGDYLPTATIQKGIPRLGANVVDPYTLHGAFASSFGFDLGSTDVLKLKSSWRAKELVTTDSYATPSYPTPIELFSFVGASIALGGSLTVPTTTALATGVTNVTDIRDFSITVDQGLDSNGRNIGGAGKLTRPGAIGKAAISGTITQEYDAINLRDAVLSGATLALVATFLGATDIVGAAGGSKSTIQVVLPDIRLDGELPKSNAGDVVAPPIAWKAYDNLVAAEPIYVAVRTGDSAL